MTDLEQRREILLARIEAHRAILDLEVRCARASVTSIDRLLGMVGLDGAVAGAVVSGMRLASVHDLTAAVPLLVAAVLRLLGERHAHEPPSPEQPAA